MNEIAIVGHHWGSAEAFTIVYEGDGAGEYAKHEAFVTPNAQAFVRDEKGNWTPEHVRWGKSSLDAELVSDNNPRYSMDAIRAQDAMERKYWHDTNPVA
ncbi:MAG: hypothetical protein KDE19_00420 [Caldilineaceae bacterium]|nr:hypothetical protein [Caldilineaceae bacterium]